MTNIRAFWKQLADKKEITRNDIAALCLLKALRKDDPSLAVNYLKESFKPVTNTIKLANGAYPYYALWDALCGVTTCQVAQQLTVEEKEKLRLLATAFRGSYGKVNL
jgi:hypothetical protein